MYLSSARAAGPVFQRDGPPTEMSIELTADAMNDQLTVISMVAPSPDWFSGVASLDLCNHNTGEWKDSITMDLKAYDAGTDGCFERCPEHQKHPHAPRNTSDVCWIYCFYATILGAQALIPGGATTPLTTGMPREQIEDAFATPFLPVGEGGCPAIAPPPLPDAAAASRKRRTNKPAWRERAAIAAELYRAVADEQQE